MVIPNTLTKALIAIVLVFIVYLLLSKLFKQQHQFPIQHPPYLTRTTVQTFKQLESSHPFTFYYFYSPHCQYCRTFQPKWKTLSQNLNGNKNIQLKDINASDKSNSNLTFYHNVTRVPTLVLKTPTNTHVYSGDLDVNNIQSFLETYI